MPPGKRLRFADDHRSDIELPHKSAAIPARGKRRDHYRISIAPLPARFPKRIGLAMDRRIVFLHAPVMAASKHVAVPVEKSRSDRYAAFGKADPCLFDRDLEHRLLVEFWIHPLGFYKQSGGYANLIFMSQNFQPGDFLVFQLEAGFALLRLLDIDEADGEKTWHLAAYDDFFLDVDSAESATADPSVLSSRNSHMALTTRAFESTQVAKISNIPLTPEEIKPLKKWQNDSNREISDRSVRLMLGLR